MTQHHAHHRTGLPRTIALVMIIVTGVFAAMAYGSWQSGAASPASFFASRAEVLVTAATVQEARVNGSMRYRPLVTVEWPQGSGVSHSLEGLEPSFFSWKQPAAQALIAPYPVGKPVRVRVVDYTPVADRTDLFQIFHAVFLSLFTLIAGAFTYLFVRAGRFERGRR